MTLDQAAQVAVAVATLALAYATWRMARRTGDVAIHTQREAEAVARQVEVANEQVRISNAELRASVRPWFSEAAPNRFPRAEVDSASGNFFFAMVLRNVGNGLGLMRDGYVRARNKDGELVRYPNYPHFDSPVVPVGGDVSVHFIVPPHSMGEAGLTFEQTVWRPATYGEFFINVLYTDADGGQPTWAEVHVAGRPEGDWVLHTITYQREGDEEPLATVTYG